MKSAQEQSDYLKKWRIINPDKVKEYNRNVKMRVKNGTLKKRTLVIKTEKNFVPHTDQKETLTILYLVCGHIKIIAGSRQVPKSVYCKECINK